MLDYSREFLVLAARLNYRETAALLNISQPALSRHMQQLEKEVGAQLIERYPLSLTPAGRHFLERISPIIDEIDAVCTECRAIRKRQLSQITIHPSPLGGMANNFVTTAISSTEAQVQDVEFKLKKAEKSTPYQAVVEKAVDAAPIYYYPDVIPQGIICELLYKEPISVWVNCESPLATKEDLALRDFENLFLVNPVGATFDGWNRGVRKVCEEQGFTAKVRLKDLEDVTDFILAIKPDEYLITSSLMGDRLPEGSKVVSRTLSGEPVLYPTYLLYREQTANGAFQAFLSNLRKAIVAHFPNADSPES